MGGSLGDTLNATRYHLRMFGDQRPAAPWSFGNFWGQYPTTADLPNVAGSSLQLPRDVQAGDIAWVTAAGALFVCTDPTQGAAVWNQAYTSATPPTHPPIHLNVGRLSSSVTATTPAQVPDPNALPTFGQNTIAWASTIQIIHLHMIEDLGAPGTMTIEVFRWRRSTNTHTFLGSLTWAGGSGNYGTIALAPAVTEMLPSDYFQAQLRTYSAGGGGNGITVDMHFV